MFKPPKMEDDDISPFGGKGGLFSGGKGLFDDDDEVHGTKLFSLSVFQSAFHYRNSAARNKFVLCSVLLLRVIFSLMHQSPLCLRREHRMKALEVQLRLQVR